MAGEMTTAGIKLKYKVESTAGTMPTSSFVEIPDVISLPAMDSAPEALECTPLSEQTWKRYVLGLKDPGSNVDIEANDTTAFRTAWAGLITAAATGASANPSKATWFEIAIPGRDSFYFSGEPAALGFAGASINSVMTIHGYIVPNVVTGFATASS